MTGVPAIDFVILINVGALIVYLLIMVFASMLPARVRVSTEGARGNNRVVIVMTVGLVLALVAVVVLVSKVLSP